MIYSKKAIESYLIVVIGITVLVSTLLFFTIEFIYKSDNQLCENIAFTYEVTCKQQSGYTVSVQNTGSYPISFEMNGETKEEYYVETGENKRMTVLTDSNSAKAIPIVFNGTNGDSYFCRSKQERTNTEVLRSC